MQAKLKHAMNRPVLTLALLLCAAPVLAGDVRELVGECESCHGPGGVPAESDVPPLAGMPVENLFAALEEFALDERHCTTTTYRSGDRPKTPVNMCHIAGKLSDEDRQAVADYFSGH